MKKSPEQRRGSPRGGSGANPAGGHGRDTFSCRENTRGGTVALPLSLQPPQQGWWPPWPSQPGWGPDSASVAAVEGGQNPPPRQEVARGEEGSCHPLLPAGDAGTQSCGQG